MEKADTDALRKIVALWKLDDDYVDPNYSECHSKKMLSKYRSCISVLSFQAAFQGSNKTPAIVVAVGEVRAISPTSH